MDRNQRLPKEDWENPQIVGRNKELPHCTFIPYPSLDLAIQSFDKLSKSPLLLSLNGQWKFYGVLRPMDRPREFFNIDFDASGWGEIPVPSEWQLEGFDRPWYTNYQFPPSVDTKRIPQIDPEFNPVGSYRTFFIVPSEWIGNQIYLHFAGVESAFFVWINGKHVGYSQDSMTPAEFNITRYLHSGENLLAVQVYRWSVGSYLEDQDMWRLSGIFRDVQLIARPGIHIRDFFIWNEFDTIFTDAIVHLSLKIRNLQSTTFINGSIDIALGTPFLGNQENGQIPQIIETISDIEVEQNKEITIDQTYIIPQPQKWTAETPILYPFYFIFKDSTNNVIEVARCNYGFRQVEIRNSQIYINGISVKFKGVNRHEWDPDHGRTLSYDRMVQDIIILKQNNINAVRTSHYPNHPLWYDLCDRYGIYVLDECNCESHGVSSRVPASRSEWTDNVVSRMVAMVERDKNHPCIFMWSLGNEAGMGKNFYRMKEAANKIDPSRKIHYEGDKRMKVSDVFTTMYPTLNNLIASGEHRWLVRGFLNWIPPARYRNKPRILCEYAYSPGNSTGYIQEMVDTFEKYDNLVGGFIWDFVDKAIRHRTSEGKETWAYGGDFGDIPNDRNVCCNGIVDPDRNAHPGLFEVQKAYQNIRVKLDDLTSRIIHIFNLYRFLSLDFTEIEWEIRCDGVRIACEHLDCPPIPPMQNQSLELPIHENVFLNASPNAEFHLTVKFLLKIDTLWAKRGHVVAWEQFLLPYPRQIASQGNQSENNSIQNSKPIIDSPLGIQETPNVIIVTNNIIGIYISKKSGVMHWDFFDGKKQYQNTISPNFWRTPTDNDLAYRYFAPKLKQKQIWKGVAENGRVLSIQVTSHTPDQVIIDIDINVANAKTPLHISYQISNSGVIKVSQSLTPRKRMIRFGMQLIISNKWSNVAWFGRGPHENYEDRKVGAPIGKYQCAIGDFGYNYVRPQENGNRCDVRWITFTNSEGEGIRIEPVEIQNPLSISAWPYSLEDLEKATHIHELPTRDFITVNIDHKQSGVGSGLTMETVILGRPTLPKYLLLPDREYKYNYRIIPLSKK